MLNEYFFESRAEMLESLAARSVSLLSDALRDRDAASLLVSGGSTPAPLYEALSNAALSWDRVTVALVDERWVEPNHAASNEALIRRTLLQNNADAARFVAMKSDALHAADAVGSVNQAYADIPAPFDITFLGLGSDGHTASLFPYAQGLEAALSRACSDICASIRAKQSAVTGEFTERMTLTLNSILNSREIILLITGEQKKDIYHQVLTQQDHYQMPAGAVLQQSETPVSIYWAP